jgi:hypothetical protein
LSALEAVADRPAPEFAVLSAASVAHAAAPTLRFTLRVSEPSGQDVHAIALGAQLQFEPAKRRYDDATRARLVELFGTPDRWGATTTRSFLWAQLGAVVPAFRGGTEFTLDVPCTYDLDVAAAKYVHSLADGEVPPTCRSRWCRGAARRTSSSRWRPGGR